MLDALVMFLMLLTAGCFLIAILGVTFKMVDFIMDKLNLWEKVAKIFGCD